MRCAETMFAFDVRRVNGAVELLEDETFVGGEQRLVEEEASVGLEVGTDGEDEGELCAGDVTVGERADSEADDVDGWAWEFVPEEFESRAIECGCGQFELGFGDFAVWGLMLCKRNCVLLLVLQLISGICFSCLRTV